MNFQETGAVTKTEEGSLTDGGDPHICEAANAAGMNWEKPMPSLVSAQAQHDRTTATLSQAERTVRHYEALPSLPAPAGQASARIAIKAKGRILLIDASEVIAVEAKGNYVLLHHRSNSHMLRESIATIQEKLSPHGFVRIHRSALVNAALVEEIHPWSTGEYVIHMRGGRQYTVTRTYKKNLQLLARSWIGMSGFSTG
ncbi:MAG: LytTR family DNA-binding domain-containing protein [Candidatus Sulfotelmatobacter sp.]